MENRDTETYRVFVSYAHDDKKFLDDIVKVLEDNKLTPIYDRDIPIGTAFDEHIEKYIAQAHVFMPLLTTKSSERGWVHQEIGYAMALNIPVLPVSKKNEQLPEGMIQRLNACVVDENLTDAAAKLSYSRIKDLVKKFGPKMSTYVCRVHSTERALLIADYADDVLEMDSFAVLRQKGGLSSFQIPNEEISHPIWEERYDTFPKDDYHCECQLKERRALEQHAAVAGCRLIINPELITGKKYTKIAQYARIGTMLEFLRSMPDDKIDVVINKNLSFNESVTILGDCFTAESYYRPETQGFKQTMFTRHAPGIRSKVDAFDGEFKILMERNKLKPGETRKSVIELLENIHDDIRKEL